MFVLNVDYPTQRGTIHLWSDGEPLYPHCRKREKRPENGGWHEYDSYSEVRRAIRDSSRFLEPKHCSLCDPSDEATKRADVLSGRITGAVMAAAMAVHVSDNGRSLDDLRRALDGFDVTPLLSEGTSSFFRDGIHKSLGAFLTGLNDERLSGLLQ